VLPNKLPFWICIGNWCIIVFDQRTLSVSKVRQLHELRIGKPVYDIFIDDKNINSEDYLKI